MLKYTLMTMAPEKIESLDLDQMWAPKDTKNSVKRILFFWHDFKMGNKELLKLDDVKFEKREFYSSKSAIHIQDVKINKIVISEELACVKKGCK